MHGDRAAVGGRGVGSGLGRDPATLLTGGLLVVVAVIAWLALLAQPMGGRAAGAAEPGMGMPEPAAPGGVALGDGLVFVGAWGVMMAAMMLPSATPMIALYAAIRRSASGAALRGVSTVLFAGVYLFVWAAVGAPVYLASAAVEAAAQAQPGLARVLPYALAVVLIAAGAYQLSPLKQVCLRVCRSPLGFLLQRTRSGPGGTLRLALEHALYCLGCCWALMVVLVAAGAMALQWVLLIAVVVFVEKLIPFGAWTARIVGGALVLLGVLVIINPGLAALLRGASMGL